MDKQLKQNINDYITYLLKNSTIEKPLWNKEVLIGLKKPGWTYIDGCMMVGLMGLYKYTHDEKLFQYIENFISPLVPEDGKVKIYYYDNYNNYTEYGIDSDPCNMAKVLYLLYDKTKEERYLKAINYFMDEQVRKLPRVEGNFWHKIKYYNQIWLDGLYMIQPFFAEYTKRFEDCRSYYDIVYQLEHAFAVTWEDDKKLNVHGYDGQYQDPNERMIWANPANGHSPIVWLRACGWYVMALIDCYEIIDNDFLREKIKKLIKKTIDGLLLYLDKDSNMFYQVVDKPNAPKNYLETSGTAMVCYTILKSVRLNALDKSYQKVGLDIFSGICQKYLKPINNTFSLGGICIGAGLSASKTDASVGTYEMYVTRKVVSDDGKAVGPFILAYVEADRI